MGQLEIKVPLINNNEDTVKVTQWLVAPGDPVAKGQTFVVLETSKASVDLDAERDGYLRWTGTFDGGVAPVGALLAIFTETREEPFQPPSPVEAAGKAQGKGGAAPTLKARALAAQRGIDLGAVQAAHPGVQVTEALVERFASGISAASQPSLRALIVGDGAHARYVLDVCLRSGACVVEGCVSNALPVGAPVGAMRVLGSDEDLPRLYREGIHLALIGVGSSRSGSRSNQHRAELFDRLKDLGFHLPVLRDPDASVSTTARIGEGTVIGARAVVSAHATIGRNCLVNVGTLVCHDAVVEDHVHLTPGAILAGSTFVGSGSTIGMAATILDGTRVGKNCLVPNNVRVIKDLPDGSVAPSV